MVDSLTAVRGDSITPGRSSLYTLHRLSHQETNHYRPKLVQSRKEISIGYEE